MSQHSIKGCFYHAKRTDEMQFEICRDCKTQTWVVYRVGGEHEQHAHLRSRKSCQMLIRFVRQGIMPKSEYLQGSCQRLLSPEEMIRLKKPKDRYHNSPRR